MSKEEEKELERRIYLQILEKIIAEKDEVRFFEMIFNGGGSVTIDSTSGKLIYIYSDGKVEWV